MGSGCRDQRALADFGIAAFDVLDLAALDLVEVGLEPGDRRFLDELVGELIDRLDARLLQVGLRATAYFGHEYRVTIVDGPDHGLEVLFIAEPALAVQIDTAMADKLGARRGEFIDLELFGMAEMLVDQARALGGDRDQQL